MPTGIPLCLNCTRWREKEEGMKCDAYPKGVPQAILIDETPHTKPLPGDNGLQYVPIDALSPLHIAHPLTTKS